jgi:N-acyl homoserine lactone hydrolase
MALAHPSRLHTPLEGGRAGATITVHPLVCAWTPAPPEMLVKEYGLLRSLARMRGGPRPDWVPLPITAFLLEHPGAGPMLVDTGLHASVGVDPKQSFGRILGRMYRGIEMKPDQTVAAQVRARGIAPTDVKVAIMTHLHLDHASAISDFTEATYVLGQGEWAAFQSGLPALQGYVRKHVAHAVEYREIVYSDRSVDSYSTFGRSFDLFGDGSVRLVHTPGHTHGHQSVIVRLKGREALLAGDAIYYVKTLDDGRRPLFLADEHNWQRSLREIQLYRRENPDALIIPCHDGELWKRIEERYE